MPNFFRRDDWVTDSQGNAIAGACVYVCSQPANTGSIPPSPLVQLYADPAGATPIAQPVLTDGFGHAAYYLAAGTYTVVFYSSQIKQVNLADQIITAPSSNTSWNNDASNVGTITGAINGSNVTFTLSATPVPSTSLLFAANGVVQTNWSIAGSVVTLAVAPHTGNVLNAIYQT